MRFVDQARVKVMAGDGGNGAVAFRREKYIPFGGPSGGDGGRGADVIFEGDGGMSTLLDFTHVRTIQAPRGGHGEGSDCYGRAGVDRVERVPVGTQIRDLATGELIADVTAHGQRVVVAAGGKGGRGNIHFASPIDRAPRRAEKGDPGEVKELELTLKVMADVGLLGFPNVGKSTFVAAVSAARPKIADYPFTTLAPMLGVVAIGGGVRAGGTSFVIADIPGLIPGASEGAGLGVRFLKHVERTRVLLHLVTVDPAEGREPLADYRALREELAAWSPELASRPEIVALSKSDIPEVREAYPELRERFRKIGIHLRLVSAATREGLDPLVMELFRAVRTGEVERPLPEPKPAAKRAKPAARPAAAKRAKPAARPAAAKRAKPAARPATAKRAKPATGQYRDRQGAVTATSKKAAAKKTAKRAKPAVAKAAAKKPSRARKHAGSAAVKRAKPATRPVAAKRSKPATGRYRDRQGAVTSTSKKAAAKKTAKPSRRAPPKRAKPATTRRR